MRELLSEPSYVTSRELAERLGLSRRALMYALDEVDALLASRGIGGTTRTPNRGILLPEDERARVSEILDQSAAAGEVLDLTDAFDRRFFLLFVLLCVDARCTTELFAEKTQASVRTISNDMVSLRQDLAEQNLELAWDKREGYRVHGNAFAMRNLLLGWARTLCPLETCRDVVGMMRGLFRLAGQDFDRFDVPALGKLFRVLEDVLPNHFERGARWTLLLQLAFLSVELPGRCAYDFTPADCSYLEKSANFELARFLRLQTSALLRAQLSPEEDYYLGTLFQSLPTTISGSEEQNYPFELEVVAQRLILAVGEGYQYDFQDDPELFGIIVSHLIPLVYRVLFKAQIANPLLSDIVSKYPRLHRVVVASIAELEGHLGSGVSEDECSFLTLYFASSIEKLANARRGRARVVVVCNAGNAVSRLLQYRLINAFNVDVVATTSGAELAEALAENAPVDLVVSVIDVSEGACAGVPLLRVTPFVSDEDYQRLGKYLGRRVFEAESSSGERGRGLLELLGPSCFEVRDIARDMDDLIARAGSLLFRAGLCDEEYPRQMIAAAHCFGPLTTILIGPGIIMPHAGISEHVHGTGFSFVLLRHPVSVNGQDVTCALALCTRDKSLNQYAIQQLGMLLSRTDFMKRISSVGTYQELAALVMDCLTKAEGK